MHDGTGDTAERIAHDDAVIHRGRCHRRQGHCVQNRAVGAVGQADESDASAVGRSGDEVFVVCPAHVGGRGARDIEGDGGKKVRAPPDLVGFDGWAAEGIAREFEAQNILLARAGWNVLIDRTCDCAAQIKGLEAIIRLPFRRSDQIYIVAFDYPAAQVCPGGVSHG